MRVLLTGDAGGDHILESLDKTGIGPGGRIHVDLLKVQHHGSNHSTTQDFFERVTADRYVISGNGKHGIPHATRSNGSRRRAEVSRIRST